MVTASLVLFFCLLFVLVALFVADALRTFWIKPRRLHREYALRQAHLDLSAQIMKVGDYDDRRWLRWHEELCEYARGDRDDLRPRVWPADWTEVRDV